MTKTHTGAERKNQFKPLSEADIKAFSSDANFRKGYDYYLQRAIIDATLVETELSALCQSSDGGPYQVEAILLLAGNTNPAAKIFTQCSCLQEGFCEHQIALLLTWIHQPERFSARSWLIERLNKKSREELLALLEQLLQRQPDIEPMIELLIELPLTPQEQEQNRPGKSNQRTVDISTIQSEVTSAFYHAGRGWDAPNRVAAELERLYDIGASFADADEWANAQAVYSAISNETIERYEEIEDEWQVAWILKECANALVACLTVQSTLPNHEQLDEEDRNELLTSLFNLWRFGYNYGGIEVDVAEVFAAHATAQERKMVETWLREEMRPEQETSSAWHNRHTVDFLVKLKQADHK